ncbi:hypothetical protein ABFS82_08G097000 [Erythranthe guttata]
MMGKKMRLVVSMVMVLMICIADVTPARETHQDSVEGFIICMNECLKLCNDSVMGQCIRACYDLCKNSPFEANGAFAPASPPASHGGRI